MSNPTYLLLENKRMFPIKDQIVAGFIKCLSINNKNVNAVFSDICNNGTKEYIYNFIKEMEKPTTIEDEDIATFILKQDTDYCLNTILNTAVKIEIECKPVSTNPLTISERELLSLMKIEPQHEILRDYFYSVKIYTHNEELEEVAYMHQDFTWSDGIGNIIWNCLLKKVKANWYIIFAVNSHDDKVFIDMNPTNFEYPVVIGGNPTSIEVVRTYIEGKRKKELGG